MHAVVSGARLGPVAGHGLAGWRGAMTHLNCTVAEERLLSEVVESELTSSQKETRGVCLVWPF